ncbi:hypothetical protein pb186bvf_009431 [Paramecium bursaria]
MLISILLQLSYGCYNLKESESIYLSTIERHKWSLYGSIFRGDDLNYIITNEDEIFDVQQNFAPIDYGSNYNQDSTGIVSVDVRRDLTDQQWFYQFASLQKSQGFYQIFISRDAYQSPKLLPMYKVYEENCNSIMIIQNLYWVTCINLNQIKNIYYLDDYQYEYSYDSPIQIFKSQTKYMFVNTPTCYKTFIIQLIQNEDYSQFYISVKYLEVLDVYETLLNIDISLIQKFINQYDQQILEFKIYDKQIFILGQNSFLVLELLTDCTRWSLLKYKSEQTIFISFDIMRQDNSEIDIYVATKDYQIIIYQQNSYIAYYFNSSKLDANSIQSVRCFDESRVFLITKNKITLFDFYFYNVVRTQTYEGLFLYNYYNNDLLVVDGYYSLIYKVSLGYFFVNSQKQSTELQTLYLIAQNQEKQCSFKVNFRIFDYFDNCLYKIDEQIFADIIQYPSKYLSNYLRSKDPISGSNLQSTIKLDGDPTLSMRLGYQSNVTVQGLNLDYDEIEFVQIMGKKFASYFYYIIQNKQLAVKLYKCSYDYDIPDQVICGLQNEMETKIKLNENTFQWIYYENKLLLAFIQQYNHRINFYQCDGQQLLLLDFHINTNILDTSEQITSIILKYSQIYVFMQQKLQINVYHYDLQSLYLIGTLDETNLYNYPNKFQPIKLLVDKSNKLVVLTVDGFIFFSFVEEFIMRGYIIFPNVQEINGILSGDDLIIIIYWSTLIEVIQYDITNINSVQIMKNVPLYHYRLQKPYQIQYMPETGFYFLRAYTPVLKQTVFMVFNIKKVQRCQLMTVIESGEYVFDDQAIFMTFSPQTSQTTFYANIISKNKIIWSQVSMQLQFYLTQNQSNYQHFIDHKTANIEFFNIDSPFKVEYQQKITTVNLQTQLFVQNQQLQFELQQSNVSQFVVIQQKWFIGQVLYYFIDCGQCSSLVQIRQKIHPIYRDSYTVNYTFASCSFNEHTYIILANNKLLFFDQDNYLYNTIGFTTSLSCQSIFCSSNSSWIVLSCYDVEYTQHILVILCIQDKCNIYEPKQILDARQYILEVVLLNENMIILTTSFRNYVSYSTIEFYRILPTQTAVNIQKGAIIDKSFVDSKFLYVGDIDITQLTVNGNIVYKLFAQDTYKGLYIFDLTYNPILKPKDSFILIDQYKILEEQNMNIFYTFDMFKLNIPNKPFYRIEDGTIHITLIITTAYSINYCMEITFRGIQYQHTDISYFILKVGYQHDDNRIVTRYGYLIIPYQIDDPQQWYLLSVYKLPDNNRDAPILVHAGLSVSQPKFMRFYHLQKSSNGQIYLIFNDAHQIVISQLNEDALIVISDPSQFQSQQVHIYAYNLISIPASTDLFIKKNGNSENSHFGLLVLLSLCVLIVLCTTGYMIYYRISKQRSKRRSTVVNLIN